MSTIISPASLDTGTHQKVSKIPESKLSAAISSVTKSAKEAANVALIGVAALGFVAGCEEGGDNGRILFGNGGTGGETTTNTGGAGGETTTNTGGAGGGTGGGTLTGLNICNSVANQADWENFVRNYACETAAVSDCQEMPHNPAGVAVTNQFVVVNCNESVDLEHCILVVATPNDATINWAVAVETNGVINSQSFSSPQQIIFEANETKLRAAGKVDGTANIYSDCQ